MSSLTREQDRTGQDQPLHPKMSKDATARERQLRGEDPNSPPHVHNPLHRVSLYCFPGEYVVDFVQSPKINRPLTGNILWSQPRNALQKTDPNVHVE